MAKAGREIPSPRNFIAFRLASPPSSVTAAPLARLLQALPIVRDQGSQVLGAWIDAASAEV